MPVSAGAREPLDLGGWSCVRANAEVQVVPISDIMSGKPRFVFHTTTPRKSVVRRAFRCPVDPLRFGVGAAVGGVARRSAVAPKGLVELFDSNNLT